MRVRARVFVSLQIHYNLMINKVQKKWSAIFTLNHVTTAPLLKLCAVNIANCFGQWIRAYRERKKNTFKHIRILHSKQQPK